MTLLQMSTFRQSRVSAIRQSIREVVAVLLAKLRRSAEDRIDARYAGDQWSDAIERRINDDLQNHRCGRLH